MHPHSYLCINILIYLGMDMYLFKDVPWNAKGVFLQYFIEPIKETN